jgi:hypothetical protein
VKLNCPPNLLQLDLLGEVEPDSARVRIEGQEVIIALQKAKAAPTADSAPAAAAAAAPVPALWPSLVCDAVLDKASRLARRQASLVAAEARSAARAKEASASRKKEEQADREAHWAIDARQRSALLEQQNRDRTVATEELTAWSRQIDAKGTKDKEAATIPATGSSSALSAAASSASADVAAAAAASEDADAAVPALDDVDDDAAAAAAASASKAAAAAAAVAAAASSAAAAAAATQAAALPAVRRNAPISISFTPNATAAPSMPARESTMAQKLAFQATQAAGGSVDAANKAAADAVPAANARQADESDNTLPEAWKNKGDKLMRDGDALGAITAYGAAISRDTRLSQSGSSLSSPLLRARAHSNRAAAHLSLASSRADVASIMSARNHLRSVVSDCTTALTILSAAGDPSPEDAQEASGAREAIDILSLRLRCAQRRATAHAWLGAYALAKEDLEALQKDLDMARTFRDAAVRNLTATKAAAAENQEEQEERKESDKTTSSNEAAAAAEADLPALPASLDSAKLREEAALFEQLLAALTAGQVEAYKAEGDRLLSSASASSSAAATAAGESPLSQALAAYTHALSVHPASQSVLSNRSLCLLQLRRWKECVSDCTAALALWEELWNVPKTGMQAVAPASETDPQVVAQFGRAPLPSDRSVVTPVPRAAPASAIGARVRLVVRRATARAGLHAWAAVIADLQHALALLPLTSTPTNPVTNAATNSLRAELDYAQWSSQLASATRKAAAAMADAEAASTSSSSTSSSSSSSFARAVALYTAAIEQHAKWAPSDSAASPVALAAAAVTTVSSGVEAASSAVAVSVGLFHASTLACLFADRSAAHLRAGNFAQCAQGCGVAMQLWEAQVAAEREAVAAAAKSHGNKTSASSSAASSLSFPTPSWRPVVLVRRGSARAFLGDLSLAADDYAAALRQANWGSQGREASVSGPMAERQRQHARIEEDLVKIRQAMQQR